MNNGSAEHKPLNFLRNLKASTLWNFSKKNDVTDSNNNNNNISEININDNNDTFKRSQSVRINRRLNRNNNTDSSKLMISHGKPNFIINTNSNVLKKIDKEVEINESPPMMLSSPTEKINYNTIINNLNKIPQPIEKIDNKNNGISVNNNNNNNNNDDDVYIENEISKKLRNLRSTQTAPRLKYYNKSSRSPNLLTIFANDKKSSVELENSDEKSISNIKNPSNLKLTIPETLSSSSSSTTSSNISSPSITTVGLFTTNIDNGSKILSNTKNLRLLKTPTSTTINNQHYINHGTPNYEQKTIVSFSRDLATTPNRYPDKIKVTKLISPDENSPQHQLFKDTKFVIDSNGDVNKI